MNKSTQDLLDTLTEMSEDDVQLSVSLPGGTVISSINGVDLIKALRAPTHVELTHAIDTNGPVLTQMIVELQYLADAISDNARDQDEDNEIAEEYTILAAVYTTMHAATDYLSVTFT